MATSKKPRKAYKPRTAESRKPSIVDSLMVFGPIINSLESLRGEVDSIKGYPVFTDWQGQYSRIDEALHGWIDCWNRIRPEIDTSALDNLRRKLKAGTPITEDELDRAISVMRSQQDVFRSLRRDHIKRHVDTEFIAIELEKAGVKGSRV